MTDHRILLLSRADVAALLPLDDCIVAVEEAFRLQGQGLARPPGILAFPTGEGGFHIKAALLELSRPYFAAKLNANFARNRERFGLPTIQGVIALFDADNGLPLALMDSIEITLLRTAAATAIAARHLARQDAKVAVLCGCGAQGRVQLRALTRVLRIERVFAWDADPEAARRLASELAPVLGIAISAVDELRPALRDSDVAITCTTSRCAYVRVEDVPPGMFLAAVGADSPEKQELDPKILSRARLVVDSREQCATIGELHHALAEGAIDSSVLVPELAELVSGAKPGRQSATEVTVFDSTGVALEDVAAAAAVFRKALELGRGREWNILGASTASAGRVAGGKNR